MTEIILTQNSRGPLIISIPDVGTAKCGPTYGRLQAEFSTGGNIPEIWKALSNPENYTIKLSFEAKEKAKE